MGGLDLKSYTFPELETAVAELGLPGRFSAGCTKKGCPHLPK